MQRDSKYPLLMKSSQAKEGIYQEILAEDAGWEFLNFNARILKKGQVWKGFTGENEYGIILLSGDYSVKTDQGNWKTKNGRKHVFDGIAHTLYLSRNTEFELTAESEILDILWGGAKPQKIIRPNSKSQLSPSLKYAEVTTLLGK